MIAIIVVALVTFFAAIALTVVYVFVFGSKNPALKGSEVLVGGKSFSVEVATSAVERARGLSGRESLGDGEGMYFIFDKAGDYGFWMKDMKFPIDIIWISGGKVVGIAPNAEPEPEKPVWNLKIYYPPEPVDRVLEINSGVVDKDKIKIGDSVIVQY